MAPPSRFPAPVPSFGAHARACVSNFVHGRSIVFDASCPSSRRDKKRAADSDARPDPSKREKVLVDLTGDDETPSPVFPYIDLCDHDEDEDDSVGLSSNADPPAQVASAGAATRTEDMGQQQDISPSSQTDSAVVFASASPDALLAQQENDDDDDLERELRAFLAEPEATLPDLQAGSADPVAPVTSESHSNTERAIPHYEDELVWSDDDFVDNFDDDDPTGGLLILDNPEDDPTGGRGFGNGFGSNYHSSQSR